MRLDLTPLSVLVLAIGPCALAGVTTYNVPADFSTIQAAIATAANDDIVLVAPGTYTEAINFNGKRITVQSTDGADVTFIDSSGFGINTVRFITFETVDSVLDGFTICGGGGTSVDVGGGTFALVGGGIYVNGSTPTISNCIIEDNTANLGAGAFCWNSAPAFWDCTFKNNDAIFVVGSAGGGLYSKNSNCEVDGCTFIDNTAPVGGAVLQESASCIFRACLFEDNRAAPTASGGAFYLVVSANTEITNCVLRDNDGGLGGGALLVNGGSGTNFCDVINCTFYGNVASSSGGGVTSFASITSLDNCILWANLPDQGSTPDGTLFVNYCDVQFGAPFGTGNIDSDPLFFDGPGGDYRLKAGSPCVDAGLDSIVPGDVETDYLFRDRFFGPAVDMGAIEQGLPGTTGDVIGDAFGWAVASLGDVNDDGIPDFAVGAPDFNEQRGRVRVFSGADSTLIWNRNGQNPGDQFGYAIARSGDLNMDGKDDLIVGVPGSDVNGVDSGRIHVYSGASNAQIFQRKGKAAGDGFGFAVAGQVDVNDDMVPDVLVGAPYNDDKGADAGIADVLSGVGLAVIARRAGSGVGDNFGYAIAGIGNADGLPGDDFVVGAPFNDQNGADSGKITSFSGGAGVTGIYGAVGQNAGDGFGSALAGIGDTNDDGFDDWVVGAPFWTVDRGRVYLYKGNERDRLWIVSGSSGSKFGETLATVGDLDCDDIRDVLGGAAELDTGAGNDVGLVRILSGAGGSIIQGISGTLPGDRFGQGLSALGDLDGDGREEFLIGASGGGSTGEGIVCGYASPVTCARGGAPRPSARTGPVLQVGD